LKKPPKIAKPELFLAAQSRKFPDFLWFPNKYALSATGKLKSKVTMHIANLIYDVVFKFMMEDSKVAKAFLSAIIQEKVTELDFDTTGSTVRIPSKTEKETETKKKPEGSGLNLTVCRFDFSAWIALPGGRYKTVVIELQKAKLASDIMRFRRYLGLHYQNPNNSYGEGNDRKARQIYCIFLL
jgi:hypothetical protein